MSARRIFVELLKTSIEERVRLERGDADAGDRPSHSRVLGIVRRQALRPAA